MVVTFQRMKGYSSYTPDQPVGCT